MKANQAIAGWRLTLQVYDPNLGTNPKERDIVLQMIRTSTTNFQGVHFSMLEIRRSSYSMLHRSWYTDQEDLPRCVTPHTGRLLHRSAWFSPASCLVIASTSIFYRAFPLSQSTCIHGSSKSVGCTASSMDHFTYFFARAIASIGWKYSKVARHSRTTQWWRQKPDAV